MSNKPTIGLTGGIASGKSTVASLLARWNAGIVDADAIAREIVAPGSDGLREVVAAFGPQVLAKDGSLDREKVAAIVFSDEAARAKLQAITHPRIGKLSLERLAQQHASDAAYVVYDAPLLVEVGSHKNLDALIVVAAGQEIQIARAIARGGLTREQALQRISAQLPLSKKIEVADYVIYNDGSLDELERHARTIHDKISQRFATSVATEGA